MAAPGKPSDGPRPLLHWVVVLLVDTDVCLCVHCRRN